MSDSHPLRALFGDDFARASRQCVSCNLCRQFCHVFPQLFALLRQSSDDPASIPVSQYAEILDECWLCGRCELRCPGNLEFSRQIVRLRLARPRGARAEDRLLSRPQEIGRWGSRVASLVNALLNNQTLRRVSERVTGIDRRAVLPRVQAQSFRQWFASQNPSGGARERGNKGTRRVAYFVGCHTNYFNPSVGKAAVTVLERCGVEVVCPDFRCCGMPQIAAGDAARAEANARFNIERLARLVEQGYNVVTTCSTCSLALRQYYPELYPSRASRALADNILDIFSYLKMLRDAGDLKLNLRPRRQSVRYHYPCHARYQRSGNSMLDLLRQIPQLEVDYAPMTCCGAGGAHGFKRRYYESAQKQGAETLGFLKRVQPDAVVTDCPMCAHRIGTDSGIKTVHPIEFLMDSVAM